MEHILLIIHVFIALALIVSILVQRTSSDGMSGMGGGGGQSNPSALLSGRASANLLTRTTAVLATLFIVNSLVLSVMASRGHREESSIVEAIEQKQKSGSEQNTKAPAAEKSKESKPVAPIAE